MGGLQKNIVLIGFMGSGKSTTGASLSFKLRRPLDDTDKMIEKKEGMSIPEIFAAHGEAYFRELETELLRRLVQERAGRIFSVGGGTPLREENRKLLRELGTVVWLKASAETICQRVKGDTTRPLLQGGDPMEKIKALLAERESLYADAADVVIMTDGKKTAHVAEEIEEVLKL